MTISDVAGWVCRLWEQGAISGLSISGGEPMEQAPELASLLEALQGVAPMLSIGLFSGHSEAELDRGLYRAPMESAHEKRVLWRRIRRRIDFAVLGRYDYRRPASDPLLTSRNQVLRLYSDRYSPADFEAQSVEVSIDDTGLTQITGFPVRGPLYGNAAQ